MEKGIGEFIKLFAAENNFIMNEATKRVSNALVRISPIDEGEFVADWDVAVGHWPSDTVQPLDPSKRMTRARLQSELERVKYGDAVFFENNDPVAVWLEFGLSKQAPPPFGVVRRTARKWRGFVRGAGKAAMNRVAKTLRGE